MAEDRGSIALSPTIICKVNAKRALTGCLLIPQELARAQHSGKRW